MTLVHGKRTTYIEGGCRCRPCRAANRYGFTPAQAERVARGLCMRCSRRRKGHQALCPTCLARIERQLRQHKNEDTEAERKAHRAVALVERMLEVR